MAVSCIQLWFFPVCKQSKCSVTLNHFFDLLAINIFQEVVYRACYLLYIKLSIIPNILLHLKWRLQCLPQRRKDLNTLRDLSIKFQPRKTEVEIKETSFYHSKDPVVKHCHFMFPNFVDPPRITFLRSHHLHEPRSKSVGPIAI